MYYVWSSDHWKEYRNTLNDYLKKSGMVITWMSQEVSKWLVNGL